MGSVDHSIELLCRSVECKYIALVMDCPNLSYPTITSKQREIYPWEWGTPFDATVIYMAINVQVEYILTVYTKDNRRPKGGNKISIATYV